MFDATHNQNWMGSSVPVFTVLVSEISSLTPVIASRILRISKPVRPLRKVATIKETFMCFM